MDWTTRLHKKIAGAIFAGALLFVFSGANLFASEDDVPFKSDKIDDSLQRELVIFHSLSNLNLDPHTSAYVFEAQILNSVYMVQVMWGLHVPSLFAMPEVFSS